MLDKLDVTPEQKTGASVPRARDNVKTTTRAVLRYKTAHNYVGYNS
jgi:hypothetical protein